MKTQTGKVVVGMGGWDLFPFDGLFYPKQRGRGFRKLEYYSQFFDFVEVNATFYNSTFRPPQAKKWLQDVSGNKDFVFAIKLYRGFTHTYEANEHDVFRIRGFLDVFAEEKKLVGLLIQFPYTFTNIKENRWHLVQLSTLFRDYPLFVEVRHRTWNRPDAFQFLSEHRLHLVNVDLPQLRNHMPLTAEVWGRRAYFRMMGRNTETWNRPWRIDDSGSYFVSDRYRYRYSEEELCDLLGLVEMVRESADETFVVFHNDPDAGSLVNGFQLRRLIEKRKQLIPSPLVRANPELKGIAREVNIDHPLFAGSSPVSTVADIRGHHSLAS